MSTRRDNHIPEELYVSKAWLKKHGHPDIPEGDGLKIFDPFPSMPKSTHADPKLSRPPLTFDTLKKAIALLEQDSIIRFEINLKLFNEIVNHIVRDSQPKFTFLNEHTLVYNEYDRIPIILKHDQVESLKIIKRKAQSAKEVNKCSLKK